MRGGEAMVTERETGTVKWFDAAKGYGFIELDRHGGEIFVHQSSIKGSEPYDSLEERQRVEFTIVQENKGPKAEDVIVLK
jgi:CspA family cold shock protein